MEEKLLKKKPYNISALEAITSNMPTEKWWLWDSGRIEAWIST